MSDNRDEVRREEIRKLLTGDTRERQTKECRRCGGDMIRGIVREASVLPKLRKSVAWECEQSIEFEEVSGPPQISIELGFVCTSCHHKIAEEEEVIIDAQEYWRMVSGRE